MTIPNDHPSTSLLPDDIYTKIVELHKKYCDLVWYARSEPKGHLEWLVTPTDIKNKAYNVKARIEELYPDEIDNIRCDDIGDWTHGFNSGMLACLRLIMMACDTTTPPEGYLEEDDSLEDIQGIEFAISMFPELTT